MLWSEVKQLWDEGLTKYIYQWWNWLDFIMICLYLCTISLRFYIFFNKKLNYIYKFKNFKFFYSFYSNYSFYSFFFKVNLF